MPLPKTGLLAQVSAAHLVSHLHIMALPALLPVLPGAWGLSFVELGLALSVFNVVSALVQAPLGFAVDRFGARRLLMAGLLLGSAAFGSLAFSGHYAWLLAAMALDFYIGAPIRRRGWRWHPQMALQGAVRWSESRLRSDCCLFHAATPALRAASKSISASRRSCGAS